MGSYDLYLALPMSCTQAYSNYRLWLITGYDDSPSMGFRYSLDCLCRPRHFLRMQSTTPHLQQWMQHFCMACTGRLYRLWASFSAAHTAVSLPGWTRIVLSMAIIMLCIIESLWCRHRWQRTVWPCISLSQSKCCSEHQRFEVRVRIKICTADAADTQIGLQMFREDYWGNICGTWLHSCEYWKD